MATWYCSDCPRSSYNGDIRDAANYFAGVIARKMYGRRGMAYCCNQDSYGGNAATYQATLGTYDKNAKHFIGSPHTFVVSRKK